MKKVLPIICGVTGVTVLTCTVAVVAEEVRKKKIYEKAAELYVNGDYSKARGMFRALGNYKNSKAYLTVCDNTIGKFDLVQRLKEGYKE